MNQYNIDQNHMPIGLRFAFFKFHVRNVYFIWYYNRRTRKHAPRAAALQIFGGSLAHAG
jgi:hypothetical protein